MNTGVVRLFRVFLRRYWIPITIIKIALLIRFAQSSTETQEYPDQILSWYLETASYTPLKVFQDWIKELPDGGTGTQLVFDYIPLAYGYITKMTRLEAGLVRLDPLCFEIMLNEGLETEDYSVINRRANPNYNLQVRLNSENFLKSISQQQSGDEFLVDYKYDPSLGEGTRIYVLDSGFEESALEKPRKYRGVIAPENVMYSDTELHLRAPWDMTDWAGQEVVENSGKRVGHGTCVASLAAGPSIGVASNAELYVVKFKSATLSNKGDRFIPFSTSLPSAVVWAWMFAIDDAINQRGPGKMKSVINFSQGIKRVEGSKQTLYLQKFMERWIEWALDNDIVVVVASGNGGKSGHATGKAAVPQINVIHNETLRDRVILVGAATIEGYLSPITSFVDPGNPTSRMIYAPGVNINCARADYPLSLFPQSGSSMAAALTSGLVAYFLGLKSLENEFPINSVARTMHDYIYQHAYKRLPPAVTDILDPNGEDTSYMLRVIREYRYPDEVKMIYNRAPDGICDAALPARMFARHTEPISSEELRLEDAAKKPIIEKRVDTIDIVVSGTIVANDPTLVPLCPVSTPGPSTTTGSPGISSTSSSSSGPSQTPGGLAIGFVEGYTYQHCYIDSEDQRVLSDALFESNTQNSPQWCADACEGYRYFGLEYGSECRCGNKLGSFEWSEETQCDKPCTGDSGHACGGTWFSTVYERDDGRGVARLTDWSYEGCYTDADERTLEAALLTAENMQPSLCAERCAGYAYFGVENGRECWCGHSITHGGSQGDESWCNVACGGDSGLIWGASYRENLYKYRWNVDRSLVVYYAEGCDGCIQGFVGYESTPSAPEINPCSDRVDFEFGGLPNSGGNPQSLDFSGTKMDGCTYSDGDGTIGQLSCPRRFANPRQCFPLDASTHNCGTASQRDVYTPAIVCSWGEEGL